VSQNQKQTPNNLILLRGDKITDEGKDKNVTIGFEPFKPINTSRYLCDSRFHREDLAQLLEADSRFGFVIVDGNGALYGVVSGSHCEVLHRFSVELPKKHGRGGNSALRFARVRLEKRHKYVHKVSEIATQCFITDAKPNVTGLIIAGSAEFKTVLTTSDLWDSRLEAVLIRPMLYISCGGLQGFNEAIELASETLKNARFVQEKQLVTRFLDQVAQDAGKYCFGIRATIQALEMGAVETLIVWEATDLKRVQIRNPNTGREEVLYLTPAEARDERLYRDQATGVELDVTDSRLFVDWIIESYKNFGTRLEIITDRSQEGNQFCKGFGGIGGLIRYRVEFEQFEEPSGAGDDSDPDFM